MSKEKDGLKTLEQMREELNKRKEALAQKRKKLDNKKKMFYYIGLGATILGLIFTSFSTILGIIVAAAGIGFIVFLNKKGEIFFKNDEDLIKMIEEESKVIAADEEAIKEKVIEDFWSSYNMDEELDNIFSVIEKSGATASNFEKGIEHFFSNTETTLTKEQVFLSMKEALLVRAFDSDNCAVAKAVAVDYFIQDVVKGEMLTLYMRFAIAKIKGDFSGWMPAFIKVLYGIAGHAFTYQCNKANPKNYKAITPDEFKTIIEHSDVLKSYTDSDPFKADSEREAWANDLYESPLKIVRSSKLGSVLNNEKFIDEMCYLAYTILRKDQENSVENVSVAEIAVAYTDFLKEIYDRINH